MPGVTNVTGPIPHCVLFIRCSSSSADGVGQRKRFMGKSPQFLDVKAAAYTARVPSWLRELTRSVAMAMGWLIACAIVVLIAGFVISVLF